VPSWLASALGYIPQWLGYQLQHVEQPGCAVAIAQRGEVLLDAAFGTADLATGEKLTARHRFRVASHSKTFAAAGIMKLRERGRLRLDDPAGMHVSGLHPQIAAATVGQLLAHSAGVVRDGEDSGQFMDRRPYRSAEEIRADLARPPTLEAGVRFKYSNHGYALLGLVIEAITGEDYRSWIGREIIAAAGLEETSPDMPAEGLPLFARGHSVKLPLGRRLVVPGDNPTNALAAAAGVVSTARDLALFYGKLQADAQQSFLSSASRREMVRAHWPDSESSLGRSYGLGIISGKVGGWDWFGHSGSFQGFITRTCVFPQHSLSVSVLTNAVDGPAHLWLDGIAQILKIFSERGGKPGERTKAWAGRWWSLWGPIDLVPVGETVLVATPALPNPLLDAAEIEVVADSEGRVVRGSGFQSIGESVRCVRAPDGSAAELWIGGTKLLPEPAFVDELAGRYVQR
jgi:D-alanyl-D-alanine carboxypeptidase